MLKIPIKALAEAGEDGGENMPEVGDSVSFSATGNIKSVDGDMAQVEVTEANGEAVQYAESGASEPDADDIEKVASEYDAAMGMKG